jgi:hypothetical protein
MILGFAGIGLLAYRRSSAFLRLKRDEVRFVHILHFPSSLGTLRE